MSALLFHPQQVLPWTGRPDKAHLQGPPAAGPSKYTSFPGYHRQLCDPLPLPAPWGCGPGPLCPAGHLHYRAAQPGPWCGQPHGACVCGAPGCGLVLPDQLPPVLHSPSNGLPSGRHSLLQLPGLWDVLEIEPGELKGTGFLCCCFPFPAKAGPRPGGAVSPWYSGRTISGLWKACSLLPLTPL